MTSQELQQKINDEMKNDMNRLSFNLKHFKDDYFISLYNEIIEKHVFNGNFKTIAEIKNKFQDDYDQLTKGSIDERIKAFKDANPVKIKK